MFNNLNEIHLDALKEVGNIGVANAATSLSVLLNQTISITVPSVEIIHIEDICDFVGGEEEILYAVFFQVFGGMEGNFFFILKEESLATLLTNLHKNIYKSLKAENTIEMNTSILNEVGNILAGSYISSLSDLMDSKLILTYPQSAKDMAGAILSYGVLSYGEVGNEAMLINTSFHYGEKHIEGYMVFLPEPSSLHLFFSKFGIDF
ncbi:chemotaxis protein CheC [Priestia filamentosa]|uniref:chemotaxis protein CheC n=1 Tax=Priestia filamentosa TaxID=1402861 RepID=UPI003978B879